MRLLTSSRAVLASLLVVFASGCVESGAPRSVASPIDMHGESSAAWRACHALLESDPPALLVAAREKGPFSVTVRNVGGFTASVELVEVAHWEDENFDGLVQESELMPIHPQLRMRILSSDCMPTGVQLQTQPRFFAPGESCTVAVELVTTHPDKSVSSAILLRGPGGILLAIPVLRPGVGEFAETEADREAKERAHEEAEREEREARAKSEHP